MDTTQAGLIRALDKAVTDMIQHPTTEGDMPDVAGAIRFAETRLADTRRDLLAEAPNYQKGHAYQIVTSRPNERSYNEPGIFTVTQEVGVSFLDLINAGALTLKWNWTQLKKFFYDHDIEFRTVYHELRDEEKVPDGPHVGEYKAKPRTTVKALPPEEMGIL